MEPLGQKLVPIELNFLRKGKKKRECYHTLIVTIVNNALCSSKRGLDFDHMIKREHTREG
jgi:hypothetical protein